MAGSRAGVVLVLGLYGHISILQSGLYCSCPPCTPHLIMHELTNLQASDMPHLPPPLPTSLLLLHNVTRQRAHYTSTVWPGWARLSALTVRKTSPSRMHRMHSLLRQLHRPRQVLLHMSARREGEGEGEGEVEGEGGSRMWSRPSRMDPAPRPLWYKTKSVQFGNPKTLNPEP
jgi:hypothetical protein